MEEFTSELDELNPKELAFVHAYLSNNFNASKGALAAGYSQSNKYVAGHHMLRKPKIQSFINSYLKSESLDKLELVKRLSDVARNIASEYINPNGEVDIEQLQADGYGHVIRKIRRLKNGRVAVEFYSAERAQESLAKVYGLVSDGMNVTVNVNEEIEKHNELSQKLTDLRNKIIPEGTEMSLQEYLAYFSTTKGTNNATNHQ